MKLKKVHVLISLCLIGIVALSLNFVLAKSNIDKIVYNTVETFGSANILRQPTPLKILEERASFTNAIYFLMDAKDNKIPATEFAYNRRINIYKKLAVSQNSVPLNIVNQQLYNYGWGSGDDKEERKSNWVSSIVNLIKKTKGTPSLFNKSSKIDKKDKKYQVTFTLTNNFYPNQNSLSKYKYMLFLVADIVNIEKKCNGIVTYENVVYDFVPLEGDQVINQDGTGLLLENENRKSLGNKREITLKSTQFELPEVKGNTGWSMYLLIENPESKSSIPFSMKVRLIK
jgi:hypothetical protein